MPVCCWCWFLGVKGGFGTGQTWKQASGLFVWAVSKDGFFLSMTFLIILESQWGVGNGNTSACELHCPTSSQWDHCFLLAQYTRITELFREYRPSYSDILPLESVRGHSSGSSGATVKRSLSCFSGYRSLKAKAFSTVTSYRLFVWWGLNIEVLKRYLLAKSSEKTEGIHCLYQTVNVCGRFFKFLGQ